MAGLKDRLTDGLYGLGWAGVKKLPEPAAAALGRRIADYAWKRRGASVLRLESNLARVVPDAGPERLRELSRAGMRSYMRYWMESFRLPTVDPKRFADEVMIEDAHHLTDGIAAGRGVIVALPHLANWDLAGAWVTSHLGVPFTTVAERLKPESLFDRFVAYRESLGMEVLPHTGGAAFGVLARRLRAGGLICLVADRDLSSSGVEVDFFGSAARMPAGPALLAQQTGALLLPATLWYGDAPVMHGRIHPPVRVPESGTRQEKTAAMTQAVADVFAAGIAEHPQDWHMLQRLWSADLEPRSAEPAREQQAQPQAQEPGQEQAQQPAPRRAERSEGRSA
ncbi:phosphatidylinositol mannoside acyltransferase [Streptomyces antimicrobicus]|uniref:Phosphatidylinositol mannoside acyltransferase n=1 Tax=Streptomyces antimicrobicus TaxID=2883108 RepID=A0ABS8BDE1_9ACTN|nr:phosphatidylinositol mannoside acyltransferase [Streptomyces antimicrobicus]MCB5182621.1 phosphatidylinositol mannoside acyltransferase [Streptomyces antimicrobicus]